MSQDAKFFVQRIKAATKTYDRQAAQAVVDDHCRYIAEAKEPFPEEEGADVLGALRKKRYFDLMERVAEALLDHGQDAPVVKRQLVQALVDQRRLPEASDAVNDLIEGARNDAKEYAEGRGLRGRVCKQIYVDAGPQTGRYARCALNRAIGYYAEVYREDPARHFWHGINWVACLARAERDGAPVDEPAAWPEIARDILARIRQCDCSDKWNMWAFGTAMEACVALEKVEEAQKWAEYYLKSKLADFFEFAGTYRQLREVWQIGQRELPSAILLPPLRGAMLKKGGGTIDLLDADQCAAERDPCLQANYGPEGLRCATWVCGLERRCDAVGRVEDAKQEQKGTGFLAIGRSLLPAWSGRTLFVTNRHVIGESDAAEQGALKPHQAHINFTRHASGQGGDRFRVKLIWESRNPDVDVSIHELQDAPSDLESLEFGRESDLDEVDGERARLYVCGHPRGEAVKISMYDNFLESLEPPFLYYRSPTDNGSSGSPVLTEGLSVVAVHRAHRDERQANEGVVIGALRREIGVDTPSL